MNLENMDLIETKQMCTLIFQKHYKYKSQNVPNPLNFGIYQQCYGNVT